MVLSQKSQFAHITLTGGDPCLVKRLSSEDYGLPPLLRRDLSSSHCAKDPAGVPERMVDEGAPGEPCCIVIWSAYIGYIVSGIESGISHTRNLYRPGEIAGIHLRLRRN